MPAFTQALARQLPSGAALGRAHRAGVERGLERVERPRAAAFLARGDAGRRSARAGLERLAASADIGSPRPAAQRAARSASRASAGPSPAPAAAGARSRIRPISASAALTGTGLVSRKLASMSGSRRYWQRAGGVELAAARAGAPARSSRAGTSFDDHGDEAVAAAAAIGKRQPVVAREHGEPVGPAGG